MTERTRSFFLQLCRYAVIFTFISAFGWCFEVIGRRIIYGILADRGFLWLPLCPIYGFTVIGIYHLFGTPKHPHRLARWASFKHPIPRYAAYFVLVTVFASLVELITSFAFMAFGVQLWTYAEQPFNLFGVICLSYSVLWGVLITVLMAIFWDSIYRLTCKIPSKVIFPLATVFCTCILTDFIICCVLMVLK